MSGGRVGREKRACGTAVRVRQSECGNARGRARDSTNRERETERERERESSNAPRCYDILVTRRESIDELSHRRDFIDPDVAHCRPTPSPWYVHVMCVVGLVP